MKSLFFITALFLSTYTSAASATYRVTFKSTFTKSTHPVSSFPRNPHFSPLIVASHNAEYSMFAMGAKATTGVKNVAETGNPTVLLSELSELISMGIVNDSKRGAGIGGNDQTSVTVTVSNDFPMISAITMIAPSPDWIIGVNAYSMLSNGKFINKRVIKLYAIDAGTDSGRSFTSGNLPTTKKEDIHPLTDVSGKPIKNSFGTLTITKL